MLPWIYNDAFEQSLQCSTNWVAKAGTQCRPLCGVGLPQVPLIKLPPGVQLKKFSSHPFHYVSNERHAGHAPKGPISRAIVPNHVTVIAHVVPMHRFCDFCPWTRCVLAHPQISCFVNPRFPNHPGAFSCCKRKKAATTSALEPCMLQRRYRLLVTFLTL